jgi:biotin synthase
VRRESVGDEVHLRGLVEFSNHCRRTCAYCGMNAGHSGLVRYRMDADEILDSARRARDFGYGTVVLQSGEDPGLEPEWLAGVVRRIKSETGLAVTLGVGERGRADYALWHKAGTDRYLLRFETSNPALFARIHSGGDSSLDARLERLRWLGELGYEVGSGVMVGIPGQTFDDLAGDLELFRKMDFDMIGIGPYLAHPNTPLGARAEAVRTATSDQAPADELTANKMVALARIACPHANLPATTALATINRAEGRENALRRGANVVMPNLTPVKYRSLYEIYPAKACIAETATQCRECQHARIRRLGRKLGRGPGPSRRALDRNGI